MKQLLTNPFIARVDSEDGGVTLTAAIEPLLSEPVIGALLAEHIDHWSEVYDATYAATTSELAGWRSSNTGEPLPAEHMIEWADRTAELVLGTGSRRILELGFGTGMLMRRLHPHVDLYVGTDIAHDPEAGGRTTPSGVSVVQAAAHESGSRSVLQAFGGARPDCVLLNSVTQCFPSVSYLACVVRSALEVVAPGGVVIIGDNRHSGLLAEFARWSGRSAETDEELLFDPSVLAAVVASTSHPARMTLAAKTLAMDSELTRYRFDAIVHKLDESSSRAPMLEPEIIDWTGRDDLGVALMKDAPFRMVGIPNRFLLPDDAAAVTGAELRRVIGSADARVLLDPADPRYLAVSSPAAAGEMHPAAIASPGLAHEPVASFARSRLVGTARREARRQGLDVPDRINSQIPTGGGHALASVHAEIAGADRAGRLSLGNGETVIADDALSQVPLAIAQLEAVALQALDRLFVEGRPAAVERHQWIVQRWEQVLESASVDHRPSLTPDGPVLDRACLALGYPAEMTAFYRQALLQLPELLLDTVSPQTLLFPDGDLGASLGKDRRSVSSAYLHGAVGHVLGRAAATRPSPLRVVELGGGAGGGTEAALDGLRGQDVEYQFTDVSSFFLNSARERYGSRMGYQLVDVNNDLTTQGVAKAGADCVVAVNVLHCAKNIRHSLSAIRPAIAPGGMLIVAEPTREHAINLATMQFLLSPLDGTPPPGRDDARSAGSVFLGEDGWRAELAAAGFRTLMTLPEADSRLSVAGQHMFVATLL